jgi:hypothetical protein
MLVSIGHSCAIRHNIEIFNNSKSETNIFDWVLVNIEAVCIILKYYNNYDKIFNFDNIIKTGNHDNKSKLIIKNFPEIINLNEKPYFISLHDVEIKYTDNDIYLFIEKYKRRLNRFINNICSSKEKLYFIYYGLISTEIKNEFIKIIKNININCNFAFCSLYDNNEEIIHDNFISINTNNYLLTEKKSSWKKDYYDWKKIFNFILNKI